MNVGSKLHGFSSQGVSYVKVCCFFSLLKYQAIAGNLRRHETRRYSVFREQMLYLQPVNYIIQLYGFTMTYMMTPPSVPNQQAKQPIKRLSKVK